VSKEWADRCLIMLIEDQKGSKTRFIRPLLQQIRRQGYRWLPTPAQERILWPMWQAHERRLAENILGESLLIPDRNRG